jgi:hypothetical protein
LNDGAQGVNGHIQSINIIPGVVFVVEDAIQWLHSTVGGRNRCSGGSSWWLLLLQE